MADQKDDRRKRLKGRVSWALSELEPNPGGITSRQYPGVRLCEAIFKLRKAGFAIETIREPHLGQFPGGHGRYVLSNADR